MRDSPFARALFDMPSFPQIRAAMGSMALVLLAACAGGGDPTTPAPSTRSAVVTRSGAGAGDVASTPAGIACGSTCSASLPVSGAITFTATPTATSTFAGWSGACSGTTPTCTVPAGTTALAVGAQFDVRTFALTVALAGTGTGTVSSAPAGITCGTDCTESYAAGSSVTLTATSSPTSTFTGWTGGGCTGTGPCTTTINAATTVTATFTLITHTLTVALAGTGTGSVSSTPVGITCGTDCTETYTTGSTITLTATPSATSTFTGWSGGGCTGTGTCTVTVNAATTVTATFALVTHPLTVTRAGAGTGTVTSTPAGIACGADCTESYTVGTAVTLTAAPAAGSTFSGWSGGCTGTGACVVTLNAATTVTATFAVATFPVTVQRTGAGGGTVTSSVAGINCGNDCDETYASGTVITLTAEPNDVSTFAGWSGGGCAGTGPCVVTVAQAVTVSAQFTAFQFRWPDSATRYCTDGAATVACPGGPDGQDGNYTIDVPSYAVLGGRVRDPMTALVWQRVPPTTGISWAAAMTYCDGLVLDGADDWRVPSVLELVSLADVGRVGPGFPLGGVFSGIPSNSFYWTSTERTGQTTQALGVNTNYPTTSFRTKTDETDRLVRCVRGRPIDGTFTATGGSVTDTRTGLVWQAASAPTTHNWGGALAYCEALVLDGRSDWRLPNAKELLSLVDPTRTGPALSPLFVAAPSVRFWSSSPVATFLTAAYAVRFDTGVSDDISTPMSEQRSVRCVR